MPSYTTMQKERFFTRHALWAGFLMNLLWTLWEFIAPVRLPRPTGPHAVGVREMHMVHQARADRSTDSGHRELHLRILHPAAVPRTTHEAMAGPHLLGLVSTPIAAGPHRALYHPHPGRLQDNLVATTGMPRILLRKLTHAATHGVVDAPWAEGERWPVVIASHGFNGHRAEYTFLLEELASHGHVVVSIEHLHHSTGWVDPGGCGPRWNPIDPERYPLMGWSIMDTYSEDHVAVREHLARMNADPGHPLHGRLDLQRVFLLGRGIGGTAAVNTLARSKDFHAAVNLDGEATDAWMSQRLHGPVLDVHGGESHFSAQKVVGVQRVTIAGAAPHHFTDLPLCTPFRFLLRPGVREKHQGIRGAVIDFLKAQG